MTAADRKTWLVAYDIRDPSRLRQVHRLLRKAGLAAQYSAFSVEANDFGIERILDSIRLLIDETADDVRAYHIPARCTIWRLGTQEMLDGIIIDAPMAARLLQDVCEDET